MTTATLRFVLPCVAVLLLVYALAPDRTIARQDQPDPDSQKSAKKEADTVNIHYLEIVTPKVDETCEALAKTHGVTFGEPVAGFGNARMAKLTGGGRLGVRAPMRETEEPVVRPYLLVEDIEAAVEAARAAGGDFAMLPTEIPGEGRFAIYFLGGIQYGLWEK